MAAEFLSAEETRRLRTLDIDEDDLAWEGGSNPFNVGERVRRYRPKDLRDRESLRTDRTAFFEERLVWLYSDLGANVPAAFRLTDGSIRSLDAGCLGFLFNRRDPQVEFRLDSDGFIKSVKPIKSFRDRIKARQGREFTQPVLNGKAQAPAMSYLVGVVELGRRRVTYREVARVLNRALDLKNVTHHHVGPVVDAMMDRLRKFDRDVPLLNALVMRRDLKQPGKGIDDYLVAKFKLPVKPKGSDRVEWVEAAINEVAIYGEWRDLYRKAYGKAFKPLVKKTEMFDDDGQGDNPKYRGGPESEEHKALKAHVKAHPECLGLDLSNPQAKIEQSLLSGDRLDVLVVDGVRLIGVEVKSIKSGRDDLRRGLYQCVKYKAVMDAEAGLRGAPPSEVVLVTERALPSDLVEEARQLEVRRVVVPVNP